MIILSLWKNPNDQLWNHTKKQAHLLVSISMAWYEDFLQVNQVVLPTHGSISKRAKVWCPPPPSVLKLNIDGVFLHSICIGGIGGVVRNEKGEFLAGFAYKKDYVASSLQTSSNQGWYLIFAGLGEYNNGGEL